VYNFHGARSVATAAVQSVIFWLLMLVTLLP